MNKRVWLIFAIVLACMLFVTLRPLTTPGFWIRFLNERLEQESRFHLNASDADWSIFSPFDVKLIGAELIEQDNAQRAVYAGASWFNLRLSGLRSLDPKIEVNEVRFHDLRVGRASRLRAREEACAQGLQGELRFNSKSLEPPVWRLDLEGRDMQAQPILDFFGSALQMRTRVDVLGSFTVRGSAIDSLNTTLSGEVRLSGGPGQLDAHGIDALNRGVVRWARDSGHFVDWPELMDFERLEAKFEVLDGLDDTRFSLSFENMSLEGAGGMDIFARQIDYQFALRFLSNQEQSTFRTGKYVADVPWPIRCSGSFNERLPCRLDQQALAEIALQLIKQDAKDRLSRTFGEVLQELEE